MSTMINAPLYDALLEAGVSDKNARRAAAAVAEGEQMVTKVELRAELKALEVRMLLALILVQGLAVVLLSLILR